MWIVSDTGFLSIVELRPWGKDTFADKLPNYIRGTKDQRGSHLMVRARVKDDLNALKEYDPDALEMESLTSDYQYRLVISREAVATFLWNKTIDLDYDSHVKETVVLRSPKPKRGDRMKAMYRVWDAFADLQPNPPYGARPTLIPNKAPAKQGKKAQKKSLGKITHASMVKQVKAMLDDYQIKGDADAIVTVLEGMFGGVPTDLNAIDYDTIWDAIDLITMPNPTVKLN